MEHAKERVQAGAEISPNYISHLLVDGGLSHLLYRWDQQTDQDGNERDYKQ